MMKRTSIGEKDFWSDNPKLSELAKEEPMIARALTVEKEFFMDSSQRYQYLCREANRKFDMANILNIRAEGEAEGIAKGKAEGKQEMARKLLALGFPAEVVMKASDLSPSDLGLD